MAWRNNISFKKDAEKIVLLQGLTKILSNLGLKNVCARLYDAPNILLRGTKYRTRKRYRSNTLKGGN